MFMISSIAPDGIDWIREISEFLGLIPICW